MTSRSGPSATRPVTYVVATTPCGGGDLLARILRRSGVAGRPEEYFSPWSWRRTWREQWGARPSLAAYDRYIEAVRAHVTGPDGVFGVVLSWDHLAWLARYTSARDDDCDAGDPRGVIASALGAPVYLHVSRSDTAAQAIDHYEAIRTGRSFLDRRTAPDRTIPAPTRQDLRHVRWLEQLITVHERRWRAFLAAPGLSSVRLRFDDLVAHPRRVRARALDFLGIEVDEPLGGPGAVPSPEQRWSATWLAPYLEHRDALPLRPRGVPWADADRLPGRYEPRPAIRRPVGAGESIMFSCVVDSPPRLQLQSLIWYLCLTELAGVPPERIVVHAVEGTPRRHIRRLESVGARVVRVERFDERNAFANKLRQLGSDALADADRLILCDCDLAILGDVSPYVGGPEIAGIVNDNARPFYDAWVELAAHAGLDGPLVPARPPKLLRWTYVNNMNAGFLVVPRPWTGVLSEAWPRWLRWVLEVTGGERRWPVGVGFHALQVALGLTALELDLPVRQLSSALNLTTVAPTDDPRVSAGVEPLVLHYHHKIGADGRLEPNGLPVVDRLIDRVNRMLDATTHRAVLDDAVERYDAWRLETGG